MPKVNTVLCILHKRRGISFVLSIEHSIFPLVHFYYREKGWRNPKICQLEDGAKFAITPKQVPNGAAGYYMLGLICR